MEQAVQALVSGFLPFAIRRDGNSVPRPLASALHGAVQNEVLQIHFLYMGPGSDTIKYCLNIKDDFSIYV